MLLPILILLLLTAHSHMAVTLTDPIDASAMLDLLHSLSADKTLGWSPTSDPCTWDLVTCSSSGKVTAIQIGNKTLTGTLPPSLGNLTALTRLELHSNSLTGPIPSSLSNLTSLQILLLHRNSFTSIPSSVFSAMAELESAYLDDNPFDPWALPTSLQSCTALVNFSANSANVTGPVPAFLATAFPSLNHLGLAFNFLDGGIPSAFGGAGGGRRRW